MKEQEYFEEISEEEDERREKFLLSLENENVLSIRNRADWWRYEKDFVSQLKDEYWEDYNKAVAELTATA